MRGHSLREFEALRALISTGTTTAAARRLGISQSALSRAIGQLEARLGRRLFERDAGRLQPTAEALALNEDLDPLFESLARIDGATWRTAKEAALRIVAPPTIAHRFLQRRIADFLGDHPDQRISLDIIASDALVAGIAEGRYDLGISDSASNHSGIRLLPFRASHAVCVMAEGHPLAERDVIGPADLDGRRFIALTRRHSVRSSIDRILVEAGVAPRIVIETATSVSACELVRAGLGVSLLNPFPVVLSSPPGLAVRPFAPEIAYRTCFVVPAQPAPPPAARAFIRHVRFSTPRDAFSWSV